MSEPRVRVVDAQEQQRRSLMGRYGVAYYAAGTQALARPSPRNLYYYEAFVGRHVVSVAEGDCAFWLADDRSTAHLSRGPVQLQSAHLATVLRGYMASGRSVEIGEATTLPYVNGCSTRQLFAPERPGDPTLQLLYMPPHTQEQVHHIHTTARVVYVLRGRGRSVVGMAGATVEEELTAGMVVILEPMCPHHFVTEDEALVCVPLHVFSSVGPSDLNHPMFNGTHRVDPLG